MARQGEKGKRKKERKITSCPDGLSGTHDFQVFTGHLSLGVPPQVTVLGIPYRLQQASLVAQSVKNPPAMQKAWVRSLAREDPLKKGMATPSRILAWEIPRTEEPGGLQSMGLPKSQI